MDFPYLVKWTCIKYYQTESVAQNISNNFLQNCLQEVYLKPLQLFGEKRMIKWGPRGPSEQTLATSTQETEGNRAQEAAALTIPY